MKRIQKVLLLIILFMPIIINAAIYKPYVYIKNDVNNYINKYNDKGKYLVFGLPYDLSYGSPVNNTMFTTGGLLSKEEYDISKKGDSSYLATGREYWTLTNTGSNQYYIDNTILSKSADNSSGIRVTQYVKPSVNVEGKGTYANPWVFKNQNLVTIRVENTTMGGVSLNNSSTYKESISGMIDGNEEYKFQVKENTGYMYSTSDCRITKLGNLTNTSYKYKTAPITNDTICTLSFEKRKIKISYNCNGGNSGPSSHIVVYGDTYTIADYNVCKKTGWSQTKWVTEDGIEWTPGNKSAFQIENGSQGVVNNELTLKAVWKDVTKPGIKITAYNYDSSKANNMGSTVLASEQTFTTDGTYTVNSNWINSGVLFKINTYDNESGLKQIQTRWNTSNNKTDTGNTYSGGTETYTSDLATRYSGYTGNGYRKGQWIVTDKENNVLTVTLVMKIDTVLPTVSYSVSGNSASATCSDSMSGIASGSTSKALASGNSTISGTCKDNAGNTLAYSKTYSWNSCISGSPNTCTYGCDTVWSNCAYTQNTCQARWCFEGHCQDGTSHAKRCLYYSYTEADQAGLNFFKSKCGNKGTSYAPVYDSCFTGSPSACVGDYVNANCSACHHYTNTCSGGWQ